MKTRCFTNKRTLIVVFVLVTALLAAITFSLVKTIVNAAFSGHNLNGKDLHTETLALAVSADMPAITVLTHGLGGSAGDWSNDMHMQGKNWVVPNPNNFVYSPESIIEKIRNQIPGGIKLYVAKAYSATYFNLYKEYSNIEETILTDFSQHIVVVFDSPNNNNKTHEQIYNELHYIIDKISYDYFAVKGSLPKINLVGHSRGGLINMDYAINHPKNVASLVSLGTPYNGSWYDNWFVEFLNLDGGSFNTDGGKCITGECGHGTATHPNYYYFCDLNTRRSTWNNTYAQNPHINFHALSGTTSLDMMEHIIWDNQYLQTHLNISTFEAGLIRTAYVATFIPPFTLVGVGITVGLGLLPGDICVDESSQKAIGYNGVNNWNKNFTKSNSNVNKRAQDNFPFPHNLETYDSDMQNYILSNVQFGVNSPFLDGIYEIQGKTSGKFIQTTTGAGNGLAHLWQSANTNNQRFNFVRQSDGTYKITALSSTKVLDNPGLSNSNGTQLGFYDWNGGNNQRWYVIDCGGGYVKIINKHSGKAVDINNNNTANGTPVQQWDDCSSDAQRFKLLPSQNVNICDGVYEIQGKTSGKLVRADSVGSGAAAHLWESTSTDNQKFSFSRQSDGTYKITVISSNMVLDNPGLSVSNGTQLKFYAWNGGDNQRWYVIDYGGGAVKIINKHSGKAIDINNNNTANGTSVQQWDDCGSDAQRFRLRPVGLPSASMNIVDGVYRIQGKTSGKYIHTTGGTGDGLAHLWELTNTNNQKFNFARQSDGTYKITVFSSTKALDNPEWSYSRGNQLGFYDWNGCDNQRWYVVDCGGGYVKIINKHSGLAVDINYNYTANGTPIQQWDDIGSEAQRFRLIPV